MTDLPPPRFEPMAIADRTFGADEVAAYAAVTDDFNPVHVDAAFAANTGFGVPIVHGTLVVAPLWDHLAAAGLAGGAFEVRFQRPTPVGATVGYWRRVDGETPEYAIRLHDGVTVASIVVRADG